MKNRINKLILIGTSAVLLLPFSALARDRDDYYGDRHSDRGRYHHREHEWREHEWREHHYRYSRPYFGGSYYYSPPPVQPYSGGSYYNPPPAQPYNNSEPPAYNNGYYDSNGVWRPYGN